MEQKRLRKGLIVFLVVITVCLGIIYAVAHKEFSAHFSEVNLASSQGCTETIEVGQTVRQTFTMNEEAVNSIRLLSEDGKRAVYRCELLSKDVLLCDNTVDTIVADGGFFVFYQTIPISAEEPLTLKLTALDGNQTGLCYGSTMKLARGEIAISLDGSNNLYIGDLPLGAKLCVRAVGETRYGFGEIYPYLAMGFVALLGLYCWYLLRCNQKGRNTLGLRLIYAMTRYRFLINQMVQRDFKIKYKRSVLGVLWSFLNPLLMLAVQYVVFSTLFQSDIQNYPVYLLTGIVCYSFFNEACSMSLTSIIGNANLISKVYIPKYIFPVTRLLSSLINLCFSLIPLVAVLLITKVPITPAILLLPFALLCLVMFALGLSLLLSTLMVFFRDTQFLWGVLSMIWMYGTPILYPESIIPSQFILLIKLNPLYHIIRFVRSLLIDGVSPEPKAYLLCLIACAVPLLIGTLMFKRNQDKFILYL